MDTRHVETKTGLEKKALGQHHSPAKATGSPYATILPRVRSPPDLIQTRKTAKMKIVDHHDHQMNEPLSGNP